MKKIEIDGAAVRFVEDGGRGAAGETLQTVWTMTAEQVEKHRPQFAPELAALRKSEQDKLAILRAPVKG